jgi:tyrosine-specific transport protein
MYYLMTYSYSQSSQMLGGIGLITGCCIGAGMLGLPLASASAGFIPSALILTICCLFMIATGLLLLEVNLWFDEEVSLITMTGKTLGVVGQAVCWSTFTFLFYSLTIAYGSASGELICIFSESYLSCEMGSFIGNILGSLLVGLFVYFGTASVDRLNRLLIAGLIASYIFLVAVGSKHVHSGILNTSHWKQALPALPVMLIAFGYQNLIPTLRTYFHSDVKKLRFVIILGCFSPLFIYLIWQGIILSHLPEGGIPDGTVILKLLTESNSSTPIRGAINAFSFFAIATSLLGNSLSFVDFLADGFHAKDTHIPRWVLCVIVLLPPLLISLTYPALFLTALSYAGGYATVILFGILPMLMAWKGRDSIGQGKLRLLRGGKASLLIILLFSLAVMAIQTMPKKGGKSSPQKELDRSSSSQ